MRTYLSVLICVGVVVAVAMAEGERRGIKANRLSKKRMLKRACSNAIDNCESYGQGVCTDSQYTQWVQDNCCAYCGGSSGGNVPQTTAGFQLIFGTDAPALMTGSASCADAIEDCVDYGSDVCTNAQYATWVADNCPAFCNKCPSGGATAAPAPVPVTGGSSTTCADTINNCADYTTSVCSNPDYTTWVATNCPKYCNQCPSGSSSGTNTQPSGPAITGSSSGCVYNGQVHAQGETWKDGCKFTCECNDGTTGKYTCTEMCLNWDLPSQCSLNPPAAGKCCPTPNCPAGFTLNYPPGYVEQ